MNPPPMTARSLVVNRNRFHATRWLAIAAAGLLLGGCVTRQLEPDFAEFSQSYADNMNWQMLLNLARLDQGHPAYFMAIGEVRISRTQGGSLQASGTSSHTVAGAVSRTVTNVLSGTLTPTATNSVNPSFVFIPINSDEAARQLLAPIPIEVFNTLYQQGWPVDQLMRVLVERIEVDMGDNAGERKPIVLFNSPTRAGLEDNGESFARFLRTCEIVRALQKAGRLSLAIEDNPEWKKYQDDNRNAARTSKNGSDNSGAADSRGGSNNKQPASGSSIKDQVDAAPPPVLYHFKTNGNLHSFLDQFRNDTGVRYNADGEVDHLEIVFNNSNLLVGSRNDPKANDRGPRAVLVLRSFSSVLEMVAQEQRAVDALHQGQLSTWDRIPLEQRRPVLRTDWSGLKPGKDLLPSVAALKFGGRIYQISDPADGDPLDIHARWNRDVFRLLIDLSYQVSVDITKFQRQTLELTQ